MPVSGSLVRVLVFIATLQPGWVTAQQTVDLGDFPTAKELWLCHISGDLNPTRREEVSAQGIGRIRILVADGATISKDELYAVFRPDQLELEHDSLLLEKKSITRQIEDARLAHEEKIVGLQATKAETEMSMRELKTALTMREVTADSDLAKGVQKALEATQEKLDRIERKLEILRDPETLESEISMLEIDRRKLELDYRNAKHNAELRAPYDGYISLGATIMENHADDNPPFETWTKSGELIAQITDKSSYEVVIDSYPALLNHAPKEDLLLELQSVAGEKPLFAHFVDFRQGPSAGAGIAGRSALVFRIVAQDYERAETMAGTSANGRIFQQLPEGCHIVPKAELVKLLGNRQRKPGGWGTIAKSVWPGVELVATGHLELALRHPDKEPPPEQ